MQVVDREQLLRSYETILHCTVGDLVPNRFGGLKWTHETGRQRSVVRP